MVDIFEFWSLINKAATVHPQDKIIFDRLKSSHGFDLRCLPSNVAGKPLPCRRRGAGGPQLLPGPRLVFLEYVVAVR
jgi:hypothetical protein